ncbi:S8 family peptidase [Chryseolinea sp. H1M3-3]|uniref:S8 family peptidase n=1 Tax=Chryseolinea sp. H1M3-3 TaxID=3034144 RepID=UPI0023EB81AD|nr:S8 family peptidase [Chryseolinea sp. H1M3-3]
MVWNSGKLVVIFLFAAASVGLAQVNRYIVFFKDKAGTTFTVNKPLDFLSQRAVDRRIRQAISVSEMDLPVNPNYVKGVRDLGINTFFTTKWMNGVLVQCDASSIPAIENLSFVDRVEFVAPYERLLVEGRKHVDLKTKELKTASSTKAQLQMIGLDEMHAAGYEGDNILIGIFDGGFLGVNTAPPFQHIFDENRINLSASKDFVTNSKNVFQYDEHGTEVFSVIAAYQDGFYSGGSYDADYQLFVTEDVGSEYRIEEYNWLFAAERADSAGVDVVNSSLGYYDFDYTSMDYEKGAMDGKTTIVSRAAQRLADKGVIVVCSAGNEGGISWQIITAPADAKDVLAIANVNSAGQRSGSSSIGPSADGRIKPDVAALGVNTSVIRPNGTLGTASGTSLAAPLITSLAAGVWQRYPNLTNIEVIEAIRKSASQANNPDKFLGYGIPNFKAVVNYVEDSHQENIFEIYPNPITKDTITIKPNDPGQVGSCKVEVLTAQGQTVYQADVNFSWLNRTYTSNVTGLPAGLYFMRILWGDRKFTFRMIKV